MIDTNEVYGYVREKIRLRVADKPNLFPALQKGIGVGEYNKFCTREDDLCIEGYPSSANSFLYNVLREIRENIKISHHTHSLANVKRALMYEVPVVIIFRNPLESIPSTVYRFEKPLYAQLIRYTNFYEYALKRDDRILLLSFKEVTKNTSNIIREIENYSDVSLQFKDIGEIEKNVKNHIRRWSKKNKNNRGSNLPSKNKEIEKNKIRKKLDSMTRTEKAKKIYQKLIEVSKK